MKRTLTLTITVDDDHAPDTLLDLTADFNPPVEPGEPGSVTASLLMAIADMLKAGASEVLVEEYLDKRPGVLN